LLKLTPVGISFTSRREFLSTIGAAGLVLGFDLSSRRWVTVAEASTRTFVGAPPLDGRLVYTPSLLNRDATDNGNIVTRVPQAVLQPGSVEDIRKMVVFCRQHGIKVATRGQAHTTFGQGLSDGLLIENRWLDQIHSIGPDGADVDAGVTWRQLTVDAFNSGLTPPVLTGYVGLSIGGTLAVGGVDGNTGNYRDGAQIDHVQQLEVVTGEGVVRTCSATQEPDLFAAMLGGLGQCGVITRAKLDLVPAKPMVRTYRLAYVDNAAFFSDMRTLLNRGEVDGMYNLWTPGGTTLLYVLTVQVLFDPSDPPDNDHLLRDLSLPPVAAVTVDEPYLVWAQFLDNLIAVQQLTMNWSKLIKPWFDVWLPDDSVEEYVGDLVRTLTPEDIGPGGFFILIPQRRSAMNQPYFRLPNRGHSDWIYLVDVLTASLTPLPDASFTARMLDRNRRWFDAARAVGGTRYPIGSIPFTEADWIEQYGATWRAFTSAKRTYDPDKILTPGPGIF
jgi:FAD/FMN-containing dehydrogenase